MKDAFYQSQKLLHKLNQHWFYLRVKDENVLLFPYQFTHQIPQKRAQNPKLSDALQMYCNLKPLEISTYLDRSEIHLHGFFDPHCDGSPECYNLVESLSNFIESMVNSDRENILMFTLTGTKH